MELQCALTCALTPQIPESLLLERLRRTTGVYGVAFQVHQDPQGLHHIQQNGDTESVGWVRTSLHDTLGGWGIRLTSHDPDPTDPTIEETAMDTAARLHGDPTFNATPSPAPDAQTDTREHAFTGGGALQDALTEMAFYRGYAEIQDETSWAERWTPAHDVPSMITPEATVTEAAATTEDPRTGLAQATVFQREENLDSPAQDSPTPHHARPWAGVGFWLASEREITAEDDRYLHPFIATDPLDR